MGSPKMPEVDEVAPPVTKEDASVSGDLETSLLKRRKGSSDAFLTKGQKKPSLLGSNSQL